MSKIMQKPIIIIFLISILAFNPIIGAKKSTQLQNKKTKKINRSKLKQEIKEIVANTLNKYNGVGISVHVRSKYLSRDISFAKGYKNKTTKTPLKGDNLFRIGSLTKSFTGIAILKLVKEGKINPHLSVNNYLETKVDYFDKITIKQVLNMSSGLKGYIDDNSDFLSSYLNNNPEKYLPPKTLVDKALAITDELAFEPGTDFHYTNTNYIILGMIIEKVTGKSYKKYIETEIINHFNLNNTYVANDNFIPENMVDGYYDSNRDEVRENWTKVNPSIFWSAGAIVSTSEDICNWFEIIAKHQEIQSLDDELLYQGQQITNTKNKYYTAGFLYEPNKLIGGNGTVIGFHTDAWHRIDLNTTVVVFSNFLTSSKKGDPTREINNQIFSFIEKKIK